MSLYGVFVSRPDRRLLGKGRATFVAKGERMSAASFHPLRYGTANVQPTSGMANR